MKCQAVNLQWIYWMPMRWAMKEWLDTPQRNIQVFPHSLLPWNPTPPINTQLLSLKSLDFFREMDNFLGIKVRLFILMQMDVLLICKPLLSEGIIPFLIKFHNWIHKSVSSTLITLFHQWFLGHRFPMFLISYHGYALVITVLSNQELHFCGLRSVVRTNLPEALRINLVCLFLILFFMRVEELQIQGKQWGGGVKQIRHMLVYCQTFASHLPSEQTFRMQFKLRRHFPLRWVSLGDHFHHCLPLLIMLITTQPNYLFTCLSSPSPQPGCDVPECVCMLVAQSCRTLCDPVDCNPPGYSVLGILQARIVEWVAISFYRESFQLRDRTRVSCIAGRVFTVWVTKEAHC